MELCLKSHVCHNETRGELAYVEMSDLFADDPTNVE